MLSPSGTQRRTLCLVRTKEGKMAHFLYTLLKNPSYYQGKFLPTMPQDSVHWPTLARWWSSRWLLACP